MERVKSKTVRRLRRKAGVRKRVTGVPSRPRLTVFRSLKHIYAQVIDDLAGRTLVDASTSPTKGAGSAGSAASAGGNCAAAAGVGKTLAEKAKKAGITEVVFDRNGYAYHGRIKALADAARKGGLKF